MGEVTKSLIFDRSDLREEGFILVQIFWFKGTRSVVVGTVPGYGIWSSLGPWLCYTVGLVAKQLAGLEARPACVQRPTSAITSPLRESTSWEPNVSNVQANGDGG